MEETRGNIAVDVLITYHTFDQRTIQGGVIEMDEIEEVVEGIFRFAGITVRTLPPDEVHCRSE